jgi:hypothetical protein
MGLFLYSANKQAAAMRFDIALFRLNCYKDWQVREVLFVFYRSHAPAWEYLL